jgi:hypothetical protein
MLASFSAVSSRCWISQPPPCVHQELRVGGLVVVDGGRERHEQRRGADGRDLGHGAGAGAADDQVGIGKGLRGVFNKGRELGLHAGGRVVGAQFVDLLGAALVPDLRALAGGNQRQRLGHDVIEPARAQAAAHHQQLQRAVRPAKRSTGPGWRSEGRAQRVAYPFAFAEHVREGGEDAVGHAGQHLVDHAGDRVLLVQHQRLAQQHAHHAGRKADVAAQADHHVGLDAAHHLDALPEGLEQAQRQEHQRGRALAAHAGKIDVLEARSRAAAPAGFPCWGGSRCPGRPASAHASRARAGPRPRPGRGRCGRRCRRP